MDFLEQLREVIVNALNAGEGEIESLAGRLGVPVSALVEIAMVALGPEIDAIKKRIADFVTSEVKTIETKVPAWAKSLWDEIKPAAPLTFQLSRQAEAKLATMDVASIDKLLGLT